MLDAQEGNIMRDLFDFGFNDLNHDGKIDMASTYGTTSLTEIKTATTTMARMTKRRMRKKTRPTISMMKTSRTMIWMRTRVRTVPMIMMILITTKHMTMISPTMNMKITTIPTAAMIYGEETTAIFDKLMAMRYHRVNL